MYHQEMLKDSASSKALVIFSGGLDSTVCLYIAKNEYSNVEAISFHYNQKHKIELLKAKKIAKKLEVTHTIINLPSQIFLGSSLIDKDIKVPKKSLNKNKLPNTYVPGRNILFLSMAVSYAESRNIGNILIGVNALDYSGYPDCRPDFINSFQTMVNLGIRGNNNKIKIKILTPLLSLTKKEIVILADKLNVPINLTHSCYDPIRGKPCGDCDSCILRKKGIIEAELNNKYYA
jgi:7-cyano-7-deazaguanine synthase